MEKTNLCIHVFVAGKRKGETCGKFCRKPRPNGKCAAHTPRNKCPHNKRKERCIDCGGSELCIHDITKRICKVCNFNGYISSILSCRITEALKDADEKGGINRLGCNIEEFVNYMDMQLENQIIPDGRVKMDWDNYADVWQFDHIIPILHGNFKNLTIETILGRLHYENIQPLYKDLNQKKGNRIN